MPSVSKGLYKWLLWRGANLEDFADRLNHFWTFGLLLVLACVISWKQSYNSPINCWTPAEFTSTHVDFTNTQCWNSYYIQYPRDVEKAEKKIAKMINGTFLHYQFGGLFVNFPLVVSEDVDETDSLLRKMSTKRTMYQWVPLILCFQALLFKLPNLIMYILHGLSGMSFDKIAGLTSGYQQMNLSERFILGQKIGRYIFNWCQQFQNWLPWRQLTLLWLIVKFLYCVNIIAQMCLLDAFLRTTDNSTSYGDVISGNLFKNNATTWKESPAFPRHVFCDFEIVQLANVHRYTLQCDFPVNYFSEYVYRFIWVWFLFVATVTCISLVAWLLTTLIPVFRKRYISKAMAVANDTDSTAIQLYDINKFCNTIGEDGVMVLKLAAANSSEILVADVVSSMWKLRSRESSAHQPGQILSLPQVQVQPTAPTTSGIPLTSVAGQETSIETKKTD